MIQVVKFTLSPSKKRIALVHVKYHDITLCCEVVIYKRQKMWIRLPEFWVKDTEKWRFVYFSNLDRSNEFQEIVLKKIFEMVGFDLSSALIAHDNFFKKGDDKKQT